MHELSIAENLLTLVLAEAERAAVGSVTRINVALGTATQVAADSLRFFLDALAADTIAAGAELCVTAVPLVVSCPACGTISEAVNNWLVCERCGSPCAAVSGRELLLESIEAT